MEPEFNLWIAVLNQAVRDIKMLIKKLNKDPQLWTNPLFRTEVLNLKRYFRSRSKAPGSFIFICDLMEVDADQAAKRIEEKYLQHLKPAITSVSPLK